MSNIWSLLILSIFFIFLIPIIFYTPQTNEGFIDKSKEHKFTLQNDKFNFNKNIITIKPASDLKNNLSNINFSFSSQPELHTIDFLKFNKISDNVFTMKSPKNNITINLSFHSSPINIVVNNYEYTIELKNSQKFSDVLNIFVHQKLCGSIKNGKILKCIRPEIYENPDIICAIFVSFIIMQKIQQIKNIDYDNYFINNKYES